MAQMLTLGVFRRLDDQLAGESRDSPMALELHKRREAALHAIFDGDGTFRVVDWGQTDDSRPHEFVTLTIASVAGAAFTYAVVPGLKWLGEKLADKVLDAALGDRVKQLVAKVFPQQEAKKLLDVIITLPDGTRVSVDPPDRAATIQIAFASGGSVSVNYKTGQESGGG